MIRHWWTERDPSDAPVWFTAEEAGAWASGWNGAVAAYKAEFATALAREQGPIWTP